MLTAFDPSHKPAKINDKNKTHAFRHQTCLKLSINTWSVQNKGNSIDTRKSNFFFVKNELMDVFWP
jgi:hypothetical protein